MVYLFLAVLGALRVFFRSRSDTALEILALRQQVAVLKRQRPRPPLNSGDRFFWTTLGRFWPGWSNVLLIVQPETVVRWHRAGFRLYWRWRSRARGGRPKITAEIRGLIRRLAQENADWGAPKIHGELLRLGFHVSERTVARYLRRVGRRGDPGKRWLATLEPKRTSIRSPWQNGTAERWVGSCRREILDHVIVMNERHLLRLLREYVSYHHQDRVHDSLEKDTPEKRAIEQRPTAHASVVAMPRLGGLHHRYTWRAAA
jgi:hypothetical protein